MQTTKNGQARETSIDRLQNLIDRLTMEDVRADHSRRSVHRTPFVRPVTVRITGTNETSIFAFSKNISPVGIGLILEDSLPERTIATLTIHTLSNRQVHIRSELRWCQPFGNGWSITGWKFIAEVRD